MHIARFCLCSTLVSSFLTPDVALARGEPGAADATAAAPQPVPPAVATPATTPAASSTPATDAPAPAVVAAPAPPLPPATQLPMPAPDPWRPRDKQANALLIAGTTMLTTIYLMTSLRGAFAIDRARKSRTDPLTGQEWPIDQRRVAYGRALLVPVLGPFVAIGYTDSAVARLGAAVSGTAQVAGAVMLLAGIVAKRRIRRARRFGWTAGATHDGAMVGIHGRF